VQYLLETLQISPQDLRAHRELGKAYLHLNQLEKAQAELEKSVQLAPQSAPTHFILAQVYRKRGLLDKAWIKSATAHSLERIWPTIIPSKCFPAQNRISKCPWPWRWVLL
jgi:tetratricopeptide (TPR) repeat protein